jgi:hypothetical protein
MCICLVSKIFPFYIRQTNEIHATRAQKEVTAPAQVSLVSPRRYQVAPLFYTTFNQLSHPQEAVDGVFFYVLLQRPTAPGTAKDTQVRQRESACVRERECVFYETNYNYTRHHKRHAATPAKYLPTAP